ncbi:MAG: response regulator [Caulobacter sp.]|nr:response regulator [Caulobacter sp.]
MSGRILIIDDDPLLREIAGELLTTAGYECLTAEDGRIGLSRLESGPVDLVLLDMIMPNMDGVETLTAIRDRWPGLPVAVMSAGTRAMSLQGLLRIAMGLGASEAIQKPLTEASVLPVVERLLQQKTRAA